MGYISKYDTKFINFVNRKHNKSFSFFDDYIMWLFYVKCRCSERMYYKLLEKDMWEFSDFQTGSPRDREKLDENWKEMERDPYGLYTDDDYIYFMQNRRY